MPRANEGRADPPWGHGVIQPLAVVVTAPVFIGAILLRGTERKFDLGLLVGRRSGAGYPGLGAPPVLAPQRQYRRRLGL